jgi:hypothetical protein
MTREEQIRKYAEEKCALCDNVGFDGDVYSLVVESIEWADAHPSEEMVSINKAKVWVRNAFVGPFGEGLADSIAEEFVKIMKGN